jgi:hypothetical protein
MRALILRMRKPTVALTIVSLGLAAWVGYLAHELEAARDALARAAATPAVGEATAPKSAAAPVPITDPAASHAPEEMKGRQLPPLGAQIQDPEKRALILRSYRQSFRQTFPRLDERLGLNEDEYTRLNNLQAEQTMRHNDLQYACSQKPGCDPLTAGAGQKEIMDAELLELLGPEKLQQYQLYQDNIQERRAVEALRGALSDAQSLGEAQAEKLIDALGDTRRQHARELEQRGVNPLFTWSQLGSYVISTATVGAEEKYAEATEFMQRQRDQAAKVLTAAQLKVFTQRQQDMLDGARTNWEYEDNFGRH